MISIESGKPSEILKGDVYKRDPDTKAWRMVLTASGIPVVDNWKMPHNWRDDIDAARYRMRVDSAVYAEFFRADAERFWQNFAK